MSAGMTLSFFECLPVSMRVREKENSRMNLALYSYLDHTGHEYYTILYIVLQPVCWVKPVSYLNMAVQGLCQQFLCFYHGQEQMTRCKIARETRKRPQKPRLHGGQLMMLQKLLQSSLSWWFLSVKWLICRGMGMLSFRAFSKSVVRVSLFERVLFFADMKITEPSTYCTKYFTLQHQVV